MRIISRGAWGARYADGFTAAPLPASEVWLHHSVTPAPADDLTAERAAMRALEDIGQQRFGGGISYTFLVMPSGRVYQGHSVGRQGAHTGGRNDVARAICLVGNYETEAPTERQVDAVAALLRHGHARGWWTQARLAGGHRDAPGASTACPGRRAYDRIGVINVRAAAGGGGAPGAPVDPLDRYYQLNSEDRTMQLEPGDRVYGKAIPDGAKVVVLNFPSGRAEGVRIQWIGPDYPTTTGRFPGDTKYPDASWVANDWSQSGVRRMRPMVITIPTTGNGAKKDPVALRLSYDWDPESAATAVGSLDFK